MTTLPQVSLSCAKWRKSTRSQGDANSCVEVAAVQPVIAVRDSKDPAGPALVFPVGAWSAFTDRIKAL